MTVGERIKELRIEFGLSQDELAKRAGYSDKTAISKLEHAGNNITLKQVKRIAIALEASPEELMGWDNKTAYASLNAFPFLPSASESGTTNKTPKEPIHYEITNSEYGLISKYRTLTHSHQEMIDKMVDEFSNIDNRTEMPGQTSLLPFA